ncbi:MAG TPA: hypothetical protein VGE74_27625 [Gemmata sp.]
MAEEKIPVACSGCKKRLGVPVTAVGKTVRCPGCGTAVRVPHPAREPAGPEPGGLADPEDLPAEPGASRPEPFGQMLAEFQATFVSVAGAGCFCGLLIVMSLVVLSSIVLFPDESPSKLVWLYPLLLLGVVCFCLGYAGWLIARIVAAFKQRVQLFSEGIIVWREGRPVRYPWDEIKSVARKTEDPSGVAAQFGLAGILVYWGMAGRELEVTIRFEDDEPVVLNGMLPGLDRLAGWVKRNINRESDDANGSAGNPFGNLY